MNQTELLEYLKALSEEDRQKLFEYFCRSCAIFINESDWAGRNYCVYCSPDPDSRD